jgi:ABC-type sugar transport system ATPase subunit
LQHDSRAGADPSAVDDAPRNSLSPDMIETDQLTRCYGNLTAVDALSIRVEPGQVLGLLGPNGAGKSTAMRMIAGFLMPTSGTARVCGHDVSREPLKAKRALGYLPEGAPSYGEMTVREFLQFIVRMRGLKADIGVSALRRSGAPAAAGGSAGSVHRYACPRACVAASDWRRRSCTIHRC